MGRDLFRANQVFAVHLCRIATTLERRTGRSLLEFVDCSDDVIGKRFSNLLDSSLAIFAVQSALAYTLEDYGVSPTDLGSASYGLLAAATFADCISIEMAANFMADLSRIVETEVDRGRMLAVLDDVTSYRADVTVGERAEIAGVNSGLTFVLGMPVVSVDSIEAKLRERDVAWDVLPVDYPFHTRWMDSGEASLRRMFGTLQCRPSAVPIICSEEGSKPVDLCADVFWKLVRYPIRVDRMLSDLHVRGVRNFVDLSPGAGLTIALRRGMLKTGDVRVYSLITPYGDAATNLERVVAKLGSDVKGWE